MPFFFQKFPRVKYQLSNGNEITAVDITKRFRLIKDSFKSKLILYSYTLKSSDTPISVAHKYYGDATLDWFIFMINQMYDPYFDWPLNDYEFKQFIRDKYGSIQSAKQTTHEYYQILSEREVLIDGTVIEQQKVIIDETAYLLLADFERSSISQYDWEKEVNEKKRIIKLVDKSYLPVLLKEFGKVFD